MKIKGWMAFCTGLILMMQMARAGDGDVAITCDKKRFQLTHHNGMEERADETKKAEKWGYTVTIQNQTMKPLTNLDVRYVLFYKHEILGVKGPPRKETQVGSKAVASIDALGQTSFETDAVTLLKSSLVGPMGGYTYFTNGAKPSAQDTLNGIWVRIYSGGTLFAEYGYPAELTSTEKWPDSANPTQ